MAVAIIASVSAGSATSLPADQASESINEAATRLLHSCGIAAPGAGATTRDTVGFFHICGDVAGDRSRLEGVQPLAEEACPFLPQRRRGGLARRGER